jgi:hypothetical protein
MFGAGIGVVDYVLTGEITLRFVLKAATVMIICAGIFVYYLKSLRSTRATSLAETRIRNWAFATASTLAVVSSFCIGLSVAGTPSQQRTVEADRTRIDNLHAIATAVKIWHNRANWTDPKATIPGNLGIMIRDGELRTEAATDPVTRAPYDYQPKGGNRYAVCADFSSSNTGQRIPTMHSDFWRYGKGKTCFMLDASEQVPW